MRKEAKKEEELDHILVKYRKCVKTILRMTSFRNIDKLCTHYKVLEQRNLGEFKYLTDLNNEVWAFYPTFYSF